MYEAFTYTASSHRFGGSSDWLNGKDADAILGSNLVPFLPLSEDDLTAVAAMELASLQVTRHCVAVCCSVLQCVAVCCSV